MTNEFLDSFCICMFLPSTIQPNRVTSNSKALKSSVVSNTVGPDSDHLPQFFAANISSNSPSGSKSNIYERNCHQELSPRKFYSWLVSRRLGVVLLKRK